MNTPQKRPVGRPTIYAPDVARARHDELSRRGNLAYRRAAEVLRAEDPDRFAALKAAALADLADERGPLPGD